MRNDMDPYQKAIEDRIADLVQYRKWLRGQYGEVFSLSNRRILQREYEVELRGLLRVRNRARRELRVESRGDHFVGVGR